MANSIPAPAPIRLGISSCLLGNSVRYDGKHKLDTYVTETLAAHFEFVPVCPEVAIGLGVPRPPIRLIGDPASPRAVGAEDPAFDVTDPLAAYGRRQARVLNDICGYIFKSRSPSCGLRRVPAHRRRGGRAAHASGIYATAFRAARPILPMEEEDRLAHTGLRDNFIERVFAYGRWRELESGGLTAARLAEFHSAHMLALMARGPRRHAELTGLLTRASPRNVRALARVYLVRFFEVLTQRTTRRMHARVLLYSLGYLKNRLSTDDRAELVENIERYRAGVLPLMTPVTLLRRHFHRCPDRQFARQVYLYPDAREFALRYSA